MCIDGFVTGSTRVSTSAAAVSGKRTIGLAVQDHTDGTNAGNVEFLSS